ncbi:S-layer homology domain-containing protein [Cohnella sp. GCM10027633]|uniref:S-layer homology domain-containing protein n=1 Tax=unclassified Cohnella TaxID=2636738 RepID=UPI0036319146
MANNSNVKKWVSGVVVASVVWSGATWTTNVANAAATPFNDVVSGSWYEKHVAKLALQGILKGSNGKFNPTVSMTRQEAVIVALRFMGIDDEADPSDVTVLPSVLNIKSDYTHSINLAFKKKVLLLDEETALGKSEEAAAKAAKKTYKGWGSTPATREWMARLLVRAIGKNEEALAAAGDKTDFSDDASINAKLKAYVSVAVESGLVKGVATSTGTAFKPLDAVTRATASTLFSRAEALVTVPYNGQVSGVMMNIASDRLTVMHSDGTTREYPLTENTAFYKKDSDSPITLAALRLYGVATLITGSDGKVGFVEMTDETPQVKSVEGKLTLSTPAQNRVTLLIGDDYKHYTYDATQLKITDAAGQTINLADLPLNVDVKLTVRLDEKVIGITVKQSVINKSGSGTVAAWNAQSLTLGVNGADGKTETFPVAANAPIKLNGTINLSADQLLVGDQIAYEVKNGNVTDIVVTRVEKPVTSVTGAFESVNKTEKLIVYKVDGKPEVKYMADSLSVKITGFVDATLDDLVKGDTITMSLDASGKINLITVTNRSVEAVRGAVVVKYDATIKALTFKDANGKQITKNVIADNTRFDLNGTKLTIASAQSIISTPGMRLTIGYNGEDIVYVSFVSKYTGIVTDNNTATKTLKLSLEGISTGTSTLSYVSPLVEIYGMATETFADVKVGDRVTVQLNSSQDQASSIYVHKNVQFEVVTVDNVSKKLTVRLPNATATETWTLGAEATIKNEAGTDVSLSSLTAGSLINVTMQGNTPLAIRTVQVFSGKVTAIDGTGNLTFLTSNGETVTRAVGTTPLVKRDGATLSLSAVQVGDLFELSKDANDRVVLELATVVSRTFWKVVDGTSKLVYLKNVSLGNKTFYTLSPQAVIRQGTTPVSLSSLKDGDAITLYAIRGIVVEIVK